MKSNYNFARRCCACAVGPWHANPIGSVPQMYARRVKPSHSWSMKYKITAIDSSVVQADNGWREWQNGLKPLIDAFRRLLYSRNFQTTRLVERNQGPRGRASSLVCRARYGSRHSLALRPWGDIHSFNARRMTNTWLTLSGSIHAPTVEWIMRQRRRPFIGFRLGIWGRRRGWEWDRPAAPPGSRAIQSWRSLAVSGLLLGLLSILTMRSPFISVTVLPNEFGPVEVTVVGGKIWSGLGKRLGLFTRVWRSLVVGIVMNWRKKHCWWSIVFLWW